MNYNPAQLIFKSKEPGAYLYFDAEKKVIQPFMFGYDYQLTYYSRKAYLPCRCIKE
jgi:hypothetical protein